MGLEQFTGTPWHTDKFTRAEGDLRRHRSRCIHHKGDGSCDYYKESRCRGAAHCDHYKENRIELDTPKAETDKPTGGKPTKELTERQVAEIFPIGDKVYHERFGTGTIIESSANKIKVLFENGTEKALSPEACLKGGLLSVEHVIRRATKEQTIEWPETKAEPVAVEPAKREEKPETVKVYDLHEDMGYSRSKVAAIKQDTQAVSKIEIPIGGLLDDMPKPDFKSKQTYLWQKKQPVKPAGNKNQDVDDPFSSFLEKYSGEEKTERERKETLKKFTEGKSKKNTGENRDYRFAIWTFILCVIAIVVYVLKEFIL